jgi:hypothetical protein
VIHFNVGEAGASAFCLRYNDERPHEGIGDRTPSTGPLVPPVPGTPDTP